MDRNDVVPPALPPMPLLLPKPPPLDAPHPFSGKRRIAVYYGLAALCQGALAWRMTNLFLDGLFVDEGTRTIFYMTLGIVYLFYLLEQAFYLCAGAYFALGGVWLAATCFTHAVSRRKPPPEWLDAISCGAFPTGLPVAIYALRQRR